MIAKSNYDDNSEDDHDNVEEDYVREAIPEEKSFSV